MGGEKFKVLSGVALEILSFKAHYILMNFLTTQYCVPMIWWRPSQKMLFFPLKEALLTVRWSRNDGLAGQVHNNLYLVLPASSQLALLLKERGEVTLYTYPLVCVVRGVFGKWCASGYSVNCVIHRLVPMRDWLPVR